MDNRHRHGGRDEHHAHRSAQAPAPRKIFLRGHHHAQDRKSTRLNSSHLVISYAVFCLKKISRRNIRRRITIPLTLSTLTLLRRITRTENILHRNFTRRQVAIQNMVASNIGISQSTFSVKVLNLFSRSRRKTNKRKSKHSAMLRNKETRHRMFIGLLNTTRKLA